MKTTYNKDINGMEGQRLYICPQRSLRLRTRKETHFPSLVVFSCNPSTAKLITKWHVSSIKDNNNNNNNNVSSRVTPTAVTAFISRLRVCMRN